MDMIDPRMDPRSAYIALAPAAAQIRETLIYLGAFIIVLGIGVGIVFAVIGYTDKHRGHHR